MTKTQYVTIPLEEYKELLLKEKPNDKSYELCERFISELKKHVEYDEHDNRYWANSIGNHMRAKDGDSMIVELMKMLKYVDFDKYMAIWNGVQTAERNRKAMEEKVAQMNEAKEIRKTGTEVGA